jgi:hypothetical protein
MGVPADNPGLPRGVLKQLVAEQQRLMAELLAEHRKLSAESARLRLEAERLRNARRAP